MRPRIRLARAAASAVRHAASRGVRRDHFRSRVSSIIHVQRCLTPRRRFPTRSKFRPILRSYCRSASAATVLAAHSVAAGYPVHHAHRGSAPAIQLPAQSAGVYRRFGGAAAVSSEVAPAEPAQLVMGIPFSLTLMGILLAHEFGHFLVPRRMAFTRLCPTSFRLQR